MASNLVNLGDLFIDFEEFDIAIKVLKDAFYIINKCYGKEHIMMSFALVGLGGAYFLKGEI